MTTTARWLSKRYSWPAAPPSASALGLLSPSMALRLPHRPLPPGRQCIANDEDEQPLAAYLNALNQAQALARPSVRAAARPIKPTA